jgi:hypothetical protein
MKFLVPASITEEQMLEDLNGLSRPPVGLTNAFKEHFHVNLRLFKKSTTTAKIYTRELRNIVDIWLEDRNYLDQRHEARREFDAINEALGLAGRESQSMGEAHGRLRSALEADDIDARMRQRLQARLQECAEEWHRFLESRVWPLEAERERKEQMLQDDARSRRRGAYILNVMMSTLEGTRNIPAKSRDGDYRVAMVPTSALFSEVVQQKPELRPKSEVDAGNYLNSNDYILALIQEKLLEEKRKVPAESGHEEESPELTSAKNGWVIRKAAWFVFVQMLTEDWKAKIARCADPQCKYPYFRLGKWNTDQKAAFCGACRKATMKEHRQRRVENDRGEAEKAVIRFVAERFRVKINRDPVGWYKDRRLQGEIAADVTGFIQDSSSAVKNRYRGKVTSRWIVAGKGDDKNWSKVIHALHAEATKRVE